MSKGEAHRKNTLVFLATYNEISNIDLMLDAILSLPISCDVLVVDDNSPDGTGARLGVRAAEDGRVNVISRSGRLGIGSAHRLGWHYARHFGYEKFVTLDADLSHDPRDIPRLVAALDAGADAAFGSRFMPGGQLDYQGWRLFLSNTANHLARTLLKLPISEYTSSFRAARLKNIPVGLIETIPKDGYEFFLTAAVRLARLNVRITEIPIHFRDRHSGVSKIPKLEILRGAANLIRLYFTRQTHDLTEPAKQLLSQWTQLIERQAVVRHESQ